MSSFLDESTDEQKTNTTRDTKKNEREEGEEEQAEDTFETFKRQGFYTLRGGLSEDTVQGFINQLEEEITNTTVRDKRFGDVCGGWGDVSLNDKTTWPKKGTRRVVECVPPGVGNHWNELKSSKSLIEALDTLMGEDGWEMPFNGENEDHSIPVRHWYCPVLFPENCENVDFQPMTTFSTETRPSILASWKEEQHELTLLKQKKKRKLASEIWQPVNRRRVRGKGWHIDPIPAVPEEPYAIKRSYDGHFFEGVVLLLILSDWYPGGGGTVLVPGSHEWTENEFRAQNRIKNKDENGDQEITHDDINHWCVNLMKDYTVRGEVLIGATEKPHINKVGDLPIFLHQCLGKKGDIVLMHPWLIHGGSTNHSNSVRLMANGMVRTTRKAYEENGNKCPILSVVPLKSK